LEVEVQEYHGQKVEKGGIENPEGGDLVEQERNEHPRCRKSAPFENPDCED